MPRFRSVLTFLLGSVVFGVSYTQAPLYYSNQNQYFLHGLAAAGHGNLDLDWLAGTRDPTPLFSAGAALTHAFLHESLFYLYYLLLQGLYFYCLAGVFAFVVGTKPGSLPHLVFVTLLVVIHAGLLRLASARRWASIIPGIFRPVSRGNTSWASACSLPSSACSCWPRCSLF